MTHRVGRRFLFLIALAALGTGCSKPKQPVLVDSPKPSPTQPAMSASPAPDDFACRLLTTEEIQSVQGEAFRHTKPSERSGAGLLVSQCYFELPTTVNSIVLTVTRKAEGGRDPSESWRDIFHPEGPGRKKEEGEEKEPLKIEGVGDEAFWTGTRVGGALYVLKANCYIRISVGGAGNQTQKIEKSKALAGSVLKRL